MASPTSLVPWQVLRFVRPFGPLDRAHATNRRQLDLANRTRDLDPARAGGRAIEDRTAAPHAVGIGHDLQALVGRLIAVVEDETMRLDDRRRADIHIVRPEAGACRRAARAQDAFGRVVEARALLGALQPL